MMINGWELPASVTQQMSQELENMQRVDDMKSFNESEIWSRDAFSPPRSANFNSSWRQLFALER